MASAKLGGCEEEKSSRPQQAPQQPQSQQALQLQRKPQRASGKPNAYAKEWSNQPHADLGLVDDDIPF